VIERLPITVMFATIRGWPDARLPIDATREQVARAGGEIVVIDGSGRPAPGPDQVGPDVRWISRPGESVFQMRSAGYQLCRGEIVAVTEDHCAPADDWIERILAAHAEHPDAIAIGGVVENGTTDHLVDWATFIVTQAPFVPPLPHGPADRIAGAATSSYKAAVLARRPDHGEMGAIELFDTAEMRRPGDILVNDDSIRVSHHQSMGFGGTAASQFHNGRTIAGFRRRAMTRGDWLRVFGFPILPLYRTARSVRIAWNKHLPRSIVLVTIPLMTFFHYAQASGEFIGYVAGPGSSPRHLR
jgi:Glycosyl transferase family 2